MKREEKMMGWLGAFVTRRYKSILLVALFLVIPCIFGAQQLQVKTQVKDLLPDDNPQVQSYVEIGEHFSGSESEFITIEGGSKQDKIACAEDLVAEMQKSKAFMQYVKTVQLRLDRNFFHQWGLLLQNEEDLNKSRQTFREVNLIPLLTNINNSFEATYLNDESKTDLENNRQENEAVSTLKQLEAFLTLLGKYLENPEAIPVDAQGIALAEAFLYGEEYGFSVDDSMLIFTYYPNFSMDDLDTVVKFGNELHRIIGKVGGRYPDLNIGYMGPISLNVDEMTAIGFDMVVPSLLALVLVFVLFMFSFHRIRVILFALVALLVGILFNYGLQGITVRVVTMITSFMGSMLIGLGIDYGIMFLTNYQLFRSQGFDPGEAIRETYLKAGMGTFLAAITTSVAFFVMGLTGTKALAQFGLTAGMGIILCYLSMTFILPSLLLCFDKDVKETRRLPVINYNFLGAMANIARRKRIVVLGVAGLATVGLIVAAIFNRFEYDIMNLEPQQMTSVQTYRQMIEKMGITPITSMVAVDSLEETHTMTRHLEQLSSVAMVDSISAYLPSPEEQRKRLTEIRAIREMRERYTNSPYQAADIVRLCDEVQRLEWNIIEIGDLSIAGLGEKNKIVRMRDGMIREIMGAETGKPGREVFQNLIRRLQEDPALYAARLSRLDVAFTRAMDDVITQMASIDRPITLTDLPESIRSQYLDKTGKHNLITIYPKDGVMEEIGRMRVFNEDLNAISPKITGMTQIMVTWFDEVMNGSKKAAIFIGLFVLICLLLDFRNWRLALIAAVPLLVGMIGMMGLYPLCGQKLNFFNIAVIPLVIGMGIDYGIHLVHRYSVEPDLGIVYRFTGKAVLLSAMTTMIGFGSLALIGSFRSIASIGSILFLGIFSCLAAALILTPALLVASKSPVATSGKIVYKK